MQQLKYDSVWLYVPSFCGRIYSPLLPWITLTTTKLMVLDTLTSDGQLVTSVNEDEKVRQNTWPTHRLIGEDVQSINDPIGWSAFHANARGPRDFDLLMSPSHHCCHPKIVAIWFVIRWILYKVLSIFLILDKCVYKTNYCL